MDDVLNKLEPNINYVLCNTNALYYPHLKGPIIYSDSKFVIIESDLRIPLAAPIDKVYRKYMKREKNTYFRNHY